MLYLTIHNDSSGSDGFGNYNCEVFVNKQILAKFRIENHKRSDGWKKLIQKCSAKIKKNDIEEFDEDHLMNRILVDSFK